jgi:hypothetical protein
MLACKQLLQGSGSSVRSSRKFDFGEQDLSKTGIR